MNDSQQSLEREFSKGHVLFREGEPGAEMFVLRSGRVSIQKRLGGEGRTVAELGKGDFFGEMAVLNERPRTATATCLEDITCLVIDKKALESMLTRSPELAIRLVRRLARRLDGADTMVEILMEPDPRARVLLGIRTKIDATEGGGAKLDAVATEVGATLEHVEAVASRLKRLRLATVSDDGILHVTDRGRFFEFLEFVERKGE